MAVSLGGCLAIPIPAPVKASHPWVKGGSPEWEFCRSLRDGVTTRAEIVATLGEPNRRSDDRFASYEAHTEAGRLVGIWSVYVAGGVLYEQMGFRHMLLLEYDSAGVLRRHDRQRFYLFWPEGTLADAEEAWRSAILPVPSS